jgi:Protein of unknown function (DUF3039)
MPHDPRARPTIAVLRDLKDGWSGPWVRRKIEQQRWEELRPLAELTHPILVKAREVMGSDPTRDHPRGRIECSGDLALAEIRSGQWRAGVWTDGDGVRWVVAAGLAKGGHQDGDDFYMALESVCATVDGCEGLKPTDVDRRLLKTETAALAMTRWELAVQGVCADLLAAALEKGVHQLPMPDPITARPAMAGVRLTFRARGGVEEYVVEILNSTRAGSNLAWKLERRVLVSIAPPCQDWDVAGGIYSAMEAVGHGERQFVTLSDAAARGELLSVDMGQVAHRVHRRHIGGSLVDGTAVRALCGVFFVATQNPEQLEECPYCRELATS